nr:BMC domain-containing protein [uncultured Vagococcus sp.]
MERVIQESVPGKQLTLAHVLASPMADICQRLGIEEGGAVGIMTVTPSETAIIAADVATKAGSVAIGFLDRFTGSLVITGDVASVEGSLQAVIARLSQFGFTVVEVTRT